MRGIVSQAKKKGVRPTWIGETLWKHMCAYWETPEAMSKSSTASRCRNSTRGGLGIYKHVSGQTSHLDVEQKMVEELGRPVSYGEVFVRTHTSKDGTFVDLKAKQVADEYDRRLAEALQQQAGDGADEQDNLSDISTQRTLTIEEKNDIFLQCTEFDQKGNPFGIGGLSQKGNKGKRKITYEDSTPAPELGEMQEELKSARLKLAEHDAENKRRDEEIKELRESHARVSELHQLLEFLKKDNPQIASYMDEDSSDQPPPANDNNS